MDSKDDNMSDLSKITVTTYDDDNEFLINE